MGVLFPVILGLEFLFRLILSGSGSTLFSGSSSDIAGSLEIGTAPREGT